MTKWEETQDESGAKTWTNKQTGEVTSKHPGHKYFRQNRKAMRDRAEAKFQKDLIARVEYEREVLEMKAEKRR